MTQHSDKSHKNKKVVVIEKVRDEYLLVSRPLLLPKKADRAF